MLWKKLVMCFVLMSVSSVVSAADTESNHVLDQQSQLQVALPSQENTSYEPSLPEVPREPSFFTAFGTVSCNLFSATLLLSNTFGRLALAGYLGYKAYESVTQSLQDDARRTKHIFKAACCFGATCMLLQDGYQWILRQGRAV